MSLQAWNLPNLIVSEKSEIRTTQGFRPELFKFPKSRIESVSCKLIMNTDTEISLQLARLLVVLLPNELVRSYNQSSKWINESQNAHQP